MTISEEIEQLIQRIAVTYPASDPKKTLFSSGALMLDVKSGSETYVLEYVPSMQKLGVSRMSTATFGWEGFENSFDNLQDAEAFLFALLEKDNEARCAEVKRGE